MGFYKRIIIKTTSKKLVAAKTTDNFFLCIAQRWFNLTNIKFSLLMFIFIIQLTAFLIPRGGFKNALLESARQPLSLKKHVLLTEQFFSNGYFDLALKEVHRVQALANLFSIFDFKKQNQALISLCHNIVNKPEQINQQINSYQLVLKAKPFAKDIYYRLSLAYWQTYKDEEALKAWNAAFYLDPNSETTTAIKSIISQ